LRLVKIPSYVSCFCSLPLSIITSYGMEIESIANSIYFPLNKLIKGISLPRQILIRCHFFFSHCFLSSTATFFLLRPWWSALPHPIPCDLGEFLAYLDLQFRGEAAHTQHQGYLKLHVCYAFLQRLHIFCDTFQALGWLLLLLFSELVFGEAFLGLGNAA